MLSVKSTSISFYERLTLNNNITCTPMWTEINKERFYLSRQVVNERFSSSILSQYDNRLFVGVRFCLTSSFLFGLDIILLYGLVAIVCSINQYFIYLVRGQYFVE